MLNNNGYKDVFTFKSNLDVKSLCAELNQGCKKQLKVGLNVLDLDKKPTMSGKMTGTIRGIRMKSMSEPKFTLQATPGGGYELASYVADLMGSGSDSYAPSDMFNKTLKAMGSAGTITGLIHKEKHKGVSNTESRQVYGMK